MFLCHNITCRKGQVNNCDDIYLHDGLHHALSTKFTFDFNSKWNYGIPVDLLNQRKMETEEDIMRFGELCQVCELTADDNDDIFVEVPNGFQDDDEVICKKGHHLSCHESESNYIDVELRPITAS